jgi:hypothetical protein
MRNLGIAALGCFSALLSVTVASADDAKSKAELAWARKIATDFLETIYDGDKTALGFLSPELSRALTYRDVLEPFLGSTNPKIISKQVAPNGCEVIFAGILEGSELSGKKVYPDKNFTLRVAKENGGRWSIRFIRVTERQVKKK